jgi:hypothetical protein
VEPFPPPKPSSDGKRVAAAIGIGCGGVLLLGLLLVGGCTYWALSPGPQDSTFHIVGSDSPGFAHLKNLAESSAARLILRQFAGEMQRVSRTVDPSSLPEDLQWLEALREQQGDPTQLLDWTAPEEATLAIEHDPVSGEAVFIAAVNFPHFVRPAKLVLDGASEGEGALQRLEYRGHTVYVPAGESSVMLTFRGGTLVVGSTREDLFTGLDRLDEAAGSEPIEPSGGFLSADETGDLYGVLPGRDVAERVFGDFLPDPNVLEDVRFGLGIDSGDSLRGRLRLLCVDSVSANQIARMIGQLSAYWASELEENGLRLDSETRLEANQVLVELYLSGISSALERYADGLIAEHGA